MAFTLREIDGRPHLVSEKLAEQGVPHAFGTRLGGASRGDFAGANMSFFSGDDPEVVRGNWRQLLEVAGLADAALHYLRQVHGTRVLEVDRDRESAPDCREAGRADGLKTAGPGHALGIITADCVPVLCWFAGGEQGPEMVAAVHAGWRGTVAGILPRLLAHLGRTPDVVALGPHIRSDRFEIGPEVLPDFQAAWAATGAEPGAALRQGRGDRWLVDLEALLLAQLAGAGVPATAVESGAPCTYSESRLFYSYRRDGPGRGSLGHVIGLSASRRS